MAKGLVVLGDSCRGGGAVIEGPGHFSVAVLNLWPGERDPVSTLNSSATQQTQPPRGGAGSSSDSQGSSGTVTVKR